jgi:FKBP-type peptidyl-prolyl cis-trans isomerase
VRIIMQFWQNLVRRFKRRASPSSAGDFDHELAAARQDQQRLAGELTGLKAEVEHGLPTVRQEQVNLLGQLNGLRTELEKELSTAGLEKQALRGALTDLQTEVDRGLSASREEQRSLLGQLTGLKAEVDRGLSVSREEQQGLLRQLSGLQAEVERGFSALRQEERSLLGRLTGLQADFEREHSAARLERQDLLGQIGELQHDLERRGRRDEELRAELQQRFDQLQSERDAVYQEVKALRSSLAEARSRQETSETRVNTLEFRLQEQRLEHQAALEEALVRERRQARRLTAALTVAAAAFVLGIVGGAINFWEVHNTTRLLAEVSQGIRDIRISMQGRPATGAPLPAAVGPSAASRKAASTPTREAPAATEAVTPEQDDGEQDLSGQKLPEPDFIASRSLPLNGHTFKSRQDANAFFEENARQPGVATLPSGLQYRVLIPGTGKSPGAGDQVLVEYRAFRPDGTETDNSFKEDLPTTFTVEQASPALKEALQQMEEGAQWELYIPANLAYPGTRKRGPHDFEPLILTVELISVVAAEPANDR